MTDDVQAQAPELSTLAKEIREYISLPGGGKARSLLAIVQDLERLAAPVDPPEDFVARMERKCRDMQDEAVRGATESARAYYRGCAETLGWVLKVYRAAPVVPPVDTREPPKNEWRLDSRGELDDVVVEDVETFRLERMSRDHVWGAVYRRDGSRTTFGLFAERSRLSLKYEHEPTAAVVPPVDRVERCSLCDVWFPVGTKCPQCGGRANRAVVPPVDTRPHGLLELFRELEIVLYGKSGNTWEANRAEAVMDILRRAGGPHGGGPHQFQPDSLNPGYCRRCSEIEAAHGGGGQ